MTRTGLRLTTALLFATTTFTQLHAQNTTAPAVDDAATNAAATEAADPAKAAADALEKVKKQGEAAAKAEADKAVAAEAEAARKAAAEAEQKAVMEAEAAAKQQAVATAEAEAQAKAKAEADAQAKAAAEAKAVQNTAAADENAATEAEADKAAAADQSVERAQPEAESTPTTKEIAPAETTTESSVDVTPSATEEVREEITETAPQELATPDRKPEAPVAATEKEPAAAVKRGSENAQPDDKAAKKAERKAERKAKRKAERKRQREAEAAKAEQKVEPTTEPTPEAEAAAEESPTIVVPDNASAEQQKRIEELERKLRSEKKKNRRELIGAGLVGLGVGAVVSGALGGEVIADQGDRVVLEQDDGTYFLRKDENELLRRNGVRVSTEQLAQGRSRTTALRPNGVEIITLRDKFGDILKRTKRFPNGDEVVLIDNESFEGEEFVNYDRKLPPVRVSIPRRDYVVEATRSNRKSLQEALSSQPVEQVERAYSLREIRANNRLREKVRRVDLDAINFQTGSARVTLSQIEKLEGVGTAMAAIVENNPNEVFLVEGYTDAVGSEVDNLLLSDRRAETVAKILVSSYGVPPENLLTQGYGERYLKVDTDGPSQANRRVTVRRITPLLQASR